MNNSISAIGGGFMPPVISGASMRQSPMQKMANLFDSIDTGGSGSISKAQFLEAFQSRNVPQNFKAMGGEAIFGMLDLNSSGSISKQEFINSMTNLMSQLRAQRAEMASDGDRDGGSAVNGSDPNKDLAAALQNLEAVLGGQPSSAPNGMAGALFNIKA